MREHREERRVGLDQQELHRPAVGGLHRTHDTRQATEERGPDDGRGRGLGTELPLEACGHVRGRQQRAVVESHPVAEQERPDETVAPDAPADRERRLDVGRALAVSDECVEQLMRDEGDRPLEGGRGIERAG